MYNDVAGWYVDGMVSSIKTENNDTLIHKIETVWCLFVDILYCFYDSFLLEGSLS